VIYAAVTDTNGSSYLVNLDQVYDIVGEEKWIHGEVNQPPFKLSFESNNHNQLGSKEEGIYNLKKCFI
jgi:hypothetical protein